MEADIILNMVEDAIHRLCFTIGVIASENDRKI